MSALGQRISAFRSSQEMRVIVVEEWGEKNSPLKLYYGTVSGSDVNRVQRKYKDFLSHPTMDSMVEMILIKCKDASGEPAFDLEDKAHLLGEPIGVIAKVFGSVFEAVTVEEQEKN
jgi:hypothetical protein